MSNANQCLGCGSILTGKDIMKSKDGQTCGDCRGEQD